MIRFRKSKTTNASPVNIQKTVKTTNGSLVLKIPLSLSEVTLGQMLELQEKPELNDLEAISILSGTPLSEVQNVINMDDLLPFGEAVQALSLQIKYLYDSDAIPAKVTFVNSKVNTTVKVISNLSVEPAGAFMAAREIIAEEIGKHIKQHAGDDNLEYFNPSLKACCQVLAHYFFCRVTGQRYNEYEAEEFCTEIKKMRVTEALPIAKHFFTCYPALSKRRTGFWHRLQLRSKKRQGSSPSKSLNTSTQ